MQCDTATIDAPADPYNDLSPEARFEKAVYIVDVIISRKRWSQNMWMDDLRNVGLLKLWQCCQSYDVTRGRSFVTYCWRNIEYSLMDEMRRLDPLPVRLRVRKTAIEKAKCALYSELRREPTKNEIMMRAFPDEKEREKAKNHEFGYQFGYTSLDVESELVRAVCDDTPLPSQVLTSKEDQKIAMSCVDTLPERTRKMVHMYYLENMKMSDIAKVMNRTPAAISLALVKAHKQLRIIYAGRNAA